MRIGQIVALTIVALIGIVLATIVALRRMQAEAQRPPTQTEPAKEHLPDVKQAMAASHATQLPTLSSTNLTLNDDELDWISLAADELRMPLTVLRGYADYLRQHVEFAERASLISISERLVTQVARLEGVIEAWSVTAQNAGDQHLPTARPTDIANLVRSLCARLTELHEPPCDILDCPPVWALIDAEVIEHALAVLIRSAKRAAPGSALEIVSRTVGDGATLRLCVAIADRREQRRGQIPDIWETLELDLARVLSEEQGGWVEIEDRAGGGAITTLWLPGRLAIHIMPPQPGQPPQMPIKRAA